MAAGDGSKVIWHNQPNVYGRYFKCSKRTSAHLDWTKKELAKKAKKDGKSYRLVIIQGCYNTGVEASAGTHDYDACLDVRIDGMTWAAAQRFLRSCGWAAFWRKPSQGPWGDHIHMISLPAFMLKFVQRVGVWVPGQVQDYYKKPPEDGLSGGGIDRTWHPKNIRDTIFQYKAYVELLSQQERRQALAGRLKALVKGNYQKRADNVRSLLRSTKRRIDELQDRLKR